MNRTQAYLKTRAGPLELFSAFMELFVSNARYVTMFLMILVHLINGAFLTLFYPLAVFSYALLEESRPAKWFWDMVIYYTIAFVFVRFATQFNFGAESYLIWMQNYYIGLEPVKEGFQMITYILCEIAIICAANIAKMNTDLLGLEDSDELDEESVSEAIKRFIENSTIQARVNRAFKNGEQIPDEDADQLVEGAAEDED